MNQVLLSRMADLLDSDGSNYTVFLKSYFRASEGVGQVQDIVQGLVGPDVAISDVCDCNLAELTEEISACLGYAGDCSAGPGPHTLKLPAFSDLLRDIVDPVGRSNSPTFGHLKFPHPVTA